MIRRMDRPVLIVGKPLLIVREHGETLFEPLKFTHLVWVPRCLHQFGVFGSFRTILLGREHRQAFLRELILNNQVAQTIKGSP
jgi:hypothetical protein